MVVSKKLPFGKQGFKCFISNKDSEKIRLLHKINFDENSRIYFLSRKGKVFIKYMETFEKVRNIIKRKFNSELIDSKKCLSMFICTSNID